MAQRGTRNEEDHDSQMSEEMSEDGDDEENEEEIEQDDGAEQSVFRQSLKMPPYEHAKRKLSQLIGMMPVLK